MKPMVTSIPHTGGPEQRASKLTRVSLGTSQYLDLSRWVASLLVVMTHVRTLVLTDYAGVSGDRGLMIKALFFITNLGHAAVVIFFVISGYLVGGRTIIVAGEKGFSLLDYALHRFVRIYIVLVPALVIGFILDVLGGRYIDNMGLYTHLSDIHVWSLDYSVAANLNYKTVLGNILLLQTIVVAPLGSNGPLWSLANEWWYYVVFGLGLASALYRGKGRRFALGVGAIGVLAILPISIALWFTLWLIGAATALLDRHWKAWPAVVGVIILVSSLALTRVISSTTGTPVSDSIMLQFLPDLLVAAAFSISLLCAKRGHWAVRGLHSRLASFSYTTYLVHFPAMLLIVSTFHRVFGFGVGEQPTGVAVLFASMVVVCLYIYAWGFAYLTERHTGQVRAWLARWLAARHSPAVQIFPTRRPLN